MIAVENVTSLDKEMHSNAVDSEVEVEVDEDSVVVVDVDSEGYILEPVVVDDAVAVEDHCRDKEQSCLDQIRLEDLLWKNPDEQNDTESLQT